MSLLVGQAYLLYVVAGRVLTIKVTCCDRFYMVLLYIRVVRIIKMEI